MRRSGLSKAPLCIALLPLAALAHPWLTHEGDLWVRTYNDTAPVKPRVRINSHGPVLIEGNSSPAQFVFTVKVAVRARTQEEARVWLEKLQVRAESQGEWLVTLAALITLAALASAGLTVWSVMATTVLE